jgi:hypothetical protein
MRSDQERSAKGLEDDLSASNTEKGHIRTRYTSARTMAYSCRTKDR